MAVFYRMPVITVLVYGPLLSRTDKQKIWEVSKLDICTFRYSHPFDAASGNESRSSYRDFNMQIGHLGLDKSY